MNNSNLVYQELLQRSLNQLEKQIKELERKNKGLRALTDKTATEIEGYKTEYQQIAQELQNYNKRINISTAGEASLDFIDNKVAEIVDRQQDSIDKIKQLESLKQQVTTARYKRKINKQIKHQQQIIQRLQKKHGRLNMAQRVIMYPKYYRTMRKLKLLSKKQGKVNVVEANIQDNELLKQTLNSNSIIDNIKGAFYDIRGQYYQKKLSHAQDVLEQMKNKHGNIRLQGANVTILPKKAIEKKKQNMSSTPQATRQQEPVMQEQKPIVEAPVIQQPAAEKVEQQPTIILSGPQPNPASHIIIPGEEAKSTPSIIIPPEDKTITAASLAEEAVQIKQQNQQAMQQQQAQEFKKAA